MRVFKVLIIFTLCFAILSIVLVQNGETRYYTSLSEVYQIVVDEMDFDFFRLKNSMDDLSDVFSGMKKCFDKNFSSFSAYSIVTPPTHLESDFLTPNYKKVLEGTSIEKIFSAIVNIFEFIKSIYEFTVALVTFLIEVLPLVFELSISLCFFLIALVADSLEFVTSLFSVFWSLLFPPAMP